MPPMTLADAVVNIGANLDPLNKGLGKAQGGLANFAGGATKLLGGALVGGAVLAAGAIAGIGAAALSVSKETSDLTNRLVGELGITEEKARQLGQVARDVFANNFAGSIAEAGDAVRVVQQQLGDLVDASDLQEITENAFRLSDAFGVDIKEGISGVKTLMENFGLSSTEAFDLLASGYQKGLDRSGDFLETITEYSNQFDAAGFRAEEMLSVLATGADGGVLGVDKIADAIKEMNIRLSEGGDNVAAAFKAAGQDFEFIQSSVRSGDEEWGDYFQNVINGLNDIEDPIERQTHLTAIFGTQAEDLGRKFTESIDKTILGMDDMKGAIDKVDTRYTNFQSVVTGVWRKIIDAATPLTDELIKIANEAMPAITTFIDETLAPTFEGWAIKARDFLTGENGLIAAITLAGTSGTWQPLIDYVSGLDDGIDDLIKKIRSLLEWFQKIPGWMGQYVFDPLEKFENTIRRAVGAPELNNGYTPDLNSSGIYDPNPSYTPESPNLSLQQPAAAWQLWSSVPQDVNVNVNVTGADPGNGARIGAQTGIEQSLSQRGIR